MNLEQQVVSLDIAKRLKELRVKQESLFHWMDCKNGLISFIPEPENFNRPEYTVGYLPSHLVKLVEHWSAFTLSELGEMLPCKLQLEVGASSSYIHAYLEINKADSWAVSYFIANNLPPKACIIDNTEANARAKMLIYLIENKLLKI